MNWQRMCPEFLKKRLFRYLLQHFLGSFFKEKPSLEQLTIDMFNGTAKVESLHLDCEFLNEKLANLFSTSMPIEIISGYVGFLSVHIPWHDLINEDCLLTVRDIHIKINVKEQHESLNSWTDEDSIVNKSSMFVSQLMNTSTHIAQECLLTTDKQDQHINSTNTDNGLLGLEAFASTIDSILSRIKINLESIHICFEHFIGIVAELDINYIHYFDVIAKNTTRSFEINGLDVSVGTVTSEPMRTISLKDTQIIKLTINNHSNPLIELNGQLSSIKCFLSLSHLNTLVETFKKLTVKTFEPSPNQSYLISNNNTGEDSMNEIYYSFIDESIIHHNQPTQIQTNSFKFYIEKLQIALVSHSDSDLSKLSINQLLSSYFDDEKETFFSENCNHLLIQVNSINLEIAQNESNNEYSMNESFISVGLIRIKEQSASILDMEDYLTGGQNCITLKYVTYESNKKKEKNLSVRILIPFSFNIDLFLFDRWLPHLARLFKTDEKISIENKKGAFNFELSCPHQIKFKLKSANVSQHIITFVFTDFSLNHDLRFKSSYLNVFYQSNESAEIQQFILAKSIEFYFKKNVIDESFDKFEDVYLDMDSLQTNYNINVSKREEYTPFSNEHSLISNENNNRILNAGTKSEIQSFSNNSKHTSNLCNELFIDDFQLVIRSQQFLADLVSLIMKWRPVYKQQQQQEPEPTIIFASNNDQLIYSNNESNQFKCVFSLNINTAKIKAFVFNSTTNQNSEFNLNLNKIETCSLFKVSSQGQQHTSSLLIDEFGLFYSANETAVLTGTNCQRIAVKSDSKEFITAIDLNELKAKLMLNEQSMWLSQLVGLFELIETNTETDQQMQLYISVTNGTLSYNPIYLDLETFISLKYFHWSMNSQLNEKLTNIEGISFYLAKNNQNVCVASSDHCELVLNNRELKLNSNLIHFKTCIDSASALIELINYVCSNGDCPMKNKPVEVIIPTETTQTQSSQSEEESFSLPADYSLIESIDILSINNIDEIQDEYEIKVFKQEPVSINHNYFTKPHSYNSLCFKSIDPKFPIPVNVYSIGELSIQWTLFKGTHFDLKHPSSDNDYMRIYFSKIKAQLSFYSNDEYQRLYRLAFAIGDIKIKDELSCSSYDMFLFRYEADHCPRRTLSSMVFVKLLFYKTSDESNYECDCKLSIQPLRFYFDQDSLVFLYDFFSQCSLSTPTETSAQSDQSQLQTFKEQELKTKPNILIRRFIFAPDLIIRFDFAGKCDFSSIDSTSKLARLLLPAVQLSNTEIKLKQISLNRIQSEQLFGLIKETWFNDLRLMSLIRGWPLFTSFIDFCEGCGYLISYPIEEYRRGGRLIYALHKGSTAFSRNTLIATVDSTNRLFYTTKTITNFFYSFMSFKQKNKVLRQKRNQPNNMREGFNNAMNAISQGICETTDELRLDFEEGTIIDVISKLPSTAFVPLVLTAEAAYEISSGIRNQWRPVEKKDN